MTLDKQCRHGFDTDCCKAMQIAEASKITAWQGQACKDVSDDADTSPSEDGDRSDTCNRELHNVLKGLKHRAP